jgi:hypothetical protein
MSMIPLSLYGVEEMLRISAVAEGRHNKKSF